MYDFPKVKSKGKNQVYGKYKKYLNSNTDELFAKKVNNKEWFVVCMYSLVNLS